MTLRVSPFFCGVVFTIGGFGLVQASEIGSVPGVALGALTMLVSVCVAMWTERHAEANALELAEYRREKFAYEACVTRLESEIEREALSPPIN